MIKKNKVKKYLMKKLKLVLKKRVEYQIFLFKNKFKFNQLLFIYIIK